MQKPLFFPGGRRSMAINATRNNLYHQLDFYLSWGQVSKACNIASEGFKSHYPGRLIMIGFD